MRQRGRWECTLRSSEPIGDQGSNQRIGEFRLCPNGHQRRRSANMTGFSLGFVPFGPRGPAGRYPDEELTLESLILAQDERWRRA